MHNEEHKAQKGLGHLIAPIDDANRDVAATLLDRGFSGPSVAFWANAFHRMDLLGGNAASGLPPGYLMFKNQRPVGIALTLASLRTDASLRTRVHVNFAAWYVEPEYRWQSPVMLRALSRIPCDVLTDLTPSPTVRSILPSFGLRQITQGVAVNLAAFHRGGGHVSPLDEAQDADFLPGLKSLLCAHAQFGNIPLALHCRDGAVIALLLRVSRWRGMKMASVLYCGSNRRLFSHLGALSAFLRRQGVWLIKLEVPTGEDAPPGWFRHDYEVKYARGEIVPDVTDYAGSELALLDFQNNRAPAQ